MSRNGSLPVVDPFADWESMFESGELDASLRHLDLSKPPPLLPGQAAAPRVILREQEDGRQEYRPPEPKMTIMKRPDSGANSGGRSADQKPRAQQKSLKQREEEYAEARQRILGKSEEQEVKEVKPQQAKTVKGTRGAPRMEILAPPVVPYTGPAPLPLGRGPPMPYSAQRQFRGPPPSHMMPGGPMQEFCSGPPPPLEASRHPRGPPPDGSRGFPAAKR